MCVTNALTNSGCYYTNTFTIKATDVCGNTVSTNVVYSWLANTGTMVLAGVVPGSYLGCNPASLPTTNSVTNGVTASNTCGSAPLIVTNALTNSGCYYTTVSYTHLIAGWPTRGR